MKRTTVNRVSTLFLILVCLTSCKPNEEAISVSTDNTKTESSNKPLPLFTLNSNGSKTYVASQIICTADLPRGVGWHGCYGGSSVNFYAKDQDFIGLDKKSLVIDKLTINGKDFRRKRNLELNAKLAPSYSNASDDGAYVSWKVTIPEGYRSAYDELKMSGSITAFKSQKLIELTSNEFDIHDFSGFQIGNILVKGTRNKENIEDHFKDMHLSDEDLRLFQETVTKFEQLDEEPTEKETEKAIRELGIDEKKLDMFRDYFFLNLFSEAKDEDRIRFTLKAKRSSLDRIEVYSDEAKLDTSGYSYISAGDYVTRTYSFKRQLAPTPKVKLKVFYWEDPEVVKLNFNF